MSWRKIALISAWSLAAMSWIIQIPVFIFASDKTTLALSLGGAAVLTELAVYATAALMGMTLIQSRKRIFSTLKQIVGLEPRSAKSIK